MHEFPDNTPSLRINDEYFQVITKIKTQLKKTPKKPPQNQKIQTTILEEIYMVFLVG